MLKITITLNDQMEAAVRANLQNQMERIAGPEPGDIIMRPKKPEAWLQEHFSNSLQFLAHGVSTPETQQLEDEIKEKQAELNAKKVGGLTVAIEK